MVDARRGLSLAQKALAAAIVVSRVEDGLECDRPVQAGIMRAVHHAHSAFAQLPGNVIRTDVLRMAGHARYNPLFSLNAAHSSM